MAEGPNWVWPVTAYDAEDLQKNIKKIISQLENPNFEKHFFDPINNPEDFCCGDVIQLDSRVPVIGKSGSPSTIPNSSSYWMLTSNACDLERTDEELKFLSMVPLVDLGNPVKEKLNYLRSYDIQRNFYLPGWPSNNCGKHYHAELSKMVAVRNLGLKTQAKVVARLKQSSWCLFHSFVVRFLARQEDRDPSKLNQS